MPKAVFLRLPDDLVEDLERYRPKTLSLTTFCAYLLELGVDRDARLPAYCVGAGYTGNPETKVQPANEDQKLSLQPSASSSKEPSSPSHYSVGEVSGWSLRKGRRG